MVAQEVLPVTRPQLPAPGLTRRHRVGVKRSREQTSRPAATTLEVRPALDADPAASVHPPTMNTEGTGANSSSTNSVCTARFATRPRSLLIAALLATPTRESDITDPTGTGAAFTHGMFGVPREVRG